MPQMSSAPVWTVRSPRQGSSPYSCAGRQFPPAFLPSSRRCRGQWPVRLGIRPCVAAARESAHWSTLNLPEVVMPRRYFFDTEFIEDGVTIDLVSIGVIDEDGR